MHGARQPDPCKSLTHSLNSGKLVQGSADVLCLCVLLAGADKADDSVPPNGTYLYTWEVRARSGPGPADPSSIVWMYHSHHQEVVDTVSGLYGAMIISRRVRSRVLCVGAS